MKQVAESEQLTPAQVLIAWAVTRGCIVIPKTSSVHRLKENFGEGGERKLSQDSMDKIAMISKEEAIDQCNSVRPDGLVGSDLL